MIFVGAHPLDRAACGRCASRSRCRPRVPPAASTRGARAHDRSRCSPPTGCSTATSCSWARIGWVESSTGPPSPTSPRQAKALEALGRQAHGGERGGRRLPDRRRARGRAAAAGQAARAAAHARARPCGTDLGKQAQAGRRIAMYRYDEFDRQFVLQRTAQFADQVQRRLSGRAERGRVQAAAAEERPLSAAPRLHAADRHPLRHAELAPAAEARRHRRAVRPRLRPFHHAAEPPVQLAGAQGRARHPGRAGRGRDARHPDLGQLHPQRHQRPLRRRRRRRGRRPAPVGRAAAPVVDPASRVHLPAAQVQDRGHRPRAADRAAVRAHDIGLDAQARRGRGDSASRSWSAAASAARR